MPPSTPPNAATRAAGPTQAETASGSSGDGGVGEPDRGDPDHRLADQLRGVPLHRVGFLADQGYLTGRHGDLPMAEADLVLPKSPQPLLTAPIGSIVMLIRALSRYRELAADRAGAMLTGRPSALASALTKVSGDLRKIPTRDLRAAEAFNAFFFAPALGPGVSLSSLLSTHPTLEKRLDQLAKMSTQL